AGEQSIEEGIADAPDVARGARAIDDTVHVDTDGLGGAAGTDRHLDLVGDGAVAEDPRRTHGEVSGHEHFLDGPSRLGRGAVAAPSRWARGSRPWRETAKSGRRAPRPARSSEMSSIVRPVPSISTDSPGRTTSSAPRTQGSRM